MSGEFGCRETCSVGSGVWELVDLTSLKMVALFYDQRGYRERGKKFLMAGCKNMVDILASLLLSFLFATTLKVMQLFL